MSDWGEVDARCCVWGIDPLDLPAYRFFNLMVYMLKENLDEDARLALDVKFQQMDNEPHPLYQVRFFHKTPGPFRNTKTKNPSSSAPGNTPIELVKEQEAKAKGKPFRVPEWWMGEQAAGKRATQMMTQLPK